MIKNHNNLKLNILNNIKFIKTIIKNMIQCQLNYYSNNKKINPLRVMMCQNNSNIMILLVIDYVHKLRELLLKKNLS